MSLVGVRAVVHVYGEWDLCELKGRMDTEVGWLRQFLDGDLRREIAIGVGSAIAIRVQYCRGKHTTA